ncbi:hypothetical protein NMG60_11021706 [Bertholletia excelsa]
MAATPEASDASDGPVLSLINKRIRGLRKKYKRILQIEESIAQRKPINKEQEEVLRSKPYVSASIEELEKLRQPLAAAVSEEISLAVQRHQVSAFPSLAADVSESKVDQEKESSAAESQPKVDLEHTVVEDLLNLLYFGSLFDVKSQNDFTSTMLTRTHERGCCLTYDYVTDDEATDLLGERDLDLISMLGSLLISRPVDSSLSHKNALQCCVEHAMHWLSYSDQAIDSDPSVTYAGLRAKLNKIMASDYFITTPEMKAPVEMAAAAGGNYASFGSMVPVSVPIQVEASDGQYEHKDGDTTDYQANETYENQSGPVEEAQEGEFDSEYLTETPAQIGEAEKSQAEDRMRGRWSKRSSLMCLEGTIRSKEVAVVLVVGGGVTLVAVEQEEAAGDVALTRMDATNITLNRLETTIQGTIITIEGEVLGAVEVVATSITNITIVQGLKSATLWQTLDLVI